MRLRKAGRTDPRDRTRSSVPRDPAAECPGGHGRIPKASAAFYRQGQACSKRYFTVTAHCGRRAGAARRFRGWFSTAPITCPQWSTVRELVGADWEHKAARHCVVLRRTALNIPVLHALSCAASYRRRSASRVTVPDTEEVTGSIPVSPTK